MIAAGTLSLSLVLLTSISVVTTGSQSGAPLIRVEGPISAIDAEALQIVVSGLTVQVTPNTVITMNGAAIDLEDLTVGTTAVVHGALMMKCLKPTKSV